MQGELDLATSFGQWQRRDRDEVLGDLGRLESMRQAGLLGGEQMPEDVHPKLEKADRRNYHYFTLTMALNYQRNSYALWRAATATHEDQETAAVFEPAEVVSMTDEALRAKLLKHRLALQKDKHVEIWRRLCAGIVTLLEGDVRNLFLKAHGDVGAILEFVQKQEKRHFPYLSGPKICHYWLYVMEQYTDVKLSSRNRISVAPDTHVVKATSRLGLISPEQSTAGNSQSVTTAAWDEVLAGSGIQPIDIHTRLWLWSRAGFPAPVEVARPTAMPGR